MPESEAIARIEGFRRRLLSMEKDSSRDLIRAYGRIWRDVSSEIDAILAQVFGEQMTLNQALKLQRLRALEVQVLGEMGRYARGAGETISDAQRRAVAIAQRGARQVVDDALPRGVTTRVLASVGIEWNTLPTAAFESFVGLAGDGGPLDRLLAPLGPQVRIGIREALAEGIVLGRGPRETAGLVRDRFGMGLTRSLTISRTETLRAHREATRLQYQANSDIVKGYRRVATLDERTCMACISLDGKHYELDQPLNEHVNGRCALVPETLSYRDLGLNVSEEKSSRPTGQEWFESQSAATQRDMMGGAKYEAWRKGEFGFDNLAKIEHNPTWGDGAVERPLKELIA